MKAQILQFHSPAREYRIELRAAAEELQDIAHNCNMRDRAAAARFVAARERVLEAKRKLFYATHPYTGDENEASKHPTI